MTGFARTEGQEGGFTWVWEIRSVNSKSLDIRFRLPHGFDALENTLKQQCGALIKRGAVNATLTIQEINQPTRLHVNEHVLAQLITLMKEVGTKIEATPPRLDAILTMRGVLELTEESVNDAVQAERLVMIEAGFAAALTGLVEARRCEGQRLQIILSQRLREIAGLVTEADLVAATQPDAISARFKQQLETILGATPPLPEDRLAQELALLIAKADVREELDRLSAHLKAADDLLHEASNIGRRFDFLCQEFNREANTLCSKSADLALTKIGIALKATIEQLREQIQNIE